VRVRIGYGVGTQGMADPESSFPALVDALEREGFDSLWLSERVSGDALDPVVGCTYAAARTTRLKVGFSVLVLPGRNTAVLTKELATLDRLSNGRLLPAFGLGVADPAEQQAFGVERGERASRFGQALAAFRALWADVRPAPVQSPIDVWMGGRAPSELRRVGRLGDGWLPGFISPTDAAAGRAAVERAAAEAGRAIDPGHWGALVVYARDGLPDVVAERLRQRLPGVDPQEVIPVGLPAVRERVERFCEVGFSKFVLVPAFEPPSWDDEAGTVAAEVLPLQA
jgi:probable F420-dependent oxidoreductase